LSITKGLAKIASKHRKPSGLTVIQGRDIAGYLCNLPVEKIWGIGNATSNYLAKMGIRYALEFAQLPETTVRGKFIKPGVEIWQELRGISVYPVIAEEKSSCASISKTKTFAPPTSDATYLFAHLMRNMESACIKARRYCLAPEKIIIFSRKIILMPSAIKQNFRDPVLFPWSFPVSFVNDLINATHRRTFTVPPVLFSAIWSRRGRCAIFPF